MKLFSGTANKPLVEKIAKHLGTSFSPLEVQTFPDGEQKVRVLDKVVEEHCVVVQPTSPLVDKNYMELFFSIDALRRSGAAQVTAIIPYLGYQRQDHVFLDGEAVSIEVIATILQALKVDKIITFDLHTPKIEEFFTTTSIIDLSALPIFAREIREQQWDSHSLLLVSPDMGGIRRIKMLSEMLGNMPYAAVVKDRDLVSGNIRDGKIEWFDNTQRDYTTAIIVDDMYASGKTTVVAAELLAKNGIERTIAFATHAVFAKEAPELLQNSLLEVVYTTDTILVPKEKHFEKLRVLSVAEEIAIKLT